MQGLRTLTMAALALLGACATVPREPAISLAVAGQHVSQSAQTTVSGLSAMVDAYPQIVLVDSAISDQQVQSMDDPDNQRLFEASLRLSKLIQLRATALGGLAAAYGALEADARFDEPGQIAPAADALATQATAFASLAGVAPASIATLAAEIVRHGAEQAAASAQKARLIAASRQINAANKLITAAIGREAGLYAQVATAIEGDRKAMIAALTAANVLKPEDQDAVLRDFLKDQGLEAAKEMPSAAVGYAVPTIRGFRAWMTRNAGANIYATQIQALTDLQAQHDAFEKGAPVSLADVNAALAQLAGWATVFETYRVQARAESAGGTAK